MLRLDANLWRMVSKEAAATGRTPRQEIEDRLERSLHESPADRLSPARAISKLVELHAEDVAQYSDTAEAWQVAMTASIPALLHELFGSSGDGASEVEDSFATASARTLAQKVRRAHLPTNRAENSFWAAQADLAAARAQPSLGKLQREELLKIQKALGLASGSSESAAPSRTSKGKK